MHRDSRQGCAACLSDQLLPIFLCTGGQATWPGEGPRTGSGPPRFATTPASGTSGPRKGRFSTIRVAMEPAHGSRTHRPAPESGSEDMSVAPRMLPSPASPAGARRQRCPALQRSEGDRPPFTVLGAPVAAGNACPPPLGGHIRLLRSRPPESVCTSSRMRCRNGP